jgi:hypothetical protein
LILPCKNEEEKWKREEKMKKGREKIKRIKVLEKIRRPTPCLPYSRQIINIPSTPSPSRAGRQAPLHPAI